MVRKLWRTISYNKNTLNILLDVNEDLELEGTKNIKPVALPDNNLDITNEGILEAFPNINEKLLKDTNGIDLIINVTKDINEKTERENKVYERTFKPKKIVITRLLIMACLIMFAITFAFDGLGAMSSITVLTAEKLGANSAYLVKNGEIWRLFSYMFLHASALHLIANMYSLYLLGTQTETFIGKGKFLIVYIVSGICGGLLSSALGGDAHISVGASGAIFGLAGAMLYFGYHYRTYLGIAIKNQILPVILINLFIGFVVKGIDNYCHIGGLIGGILITMALGIDGKSKNYEKINGMICLLLYIGILSYFLFFR